VIRIPAINILGFISTAVFITYLIASHIGLYGNVWAFMFIAGLIGSATSCFGLLSYFFKNRIPARSVPVLVFFALGITGMLFNSFYLSRFEMGSFTMAFANIGIAWLLISGNVVPAAIETLYYSVAAYFILLILTGVDSNFALAFSDSSRNGISVIMINLSAAIWISKAVRAEKMPLLPTVLTLLISLWSYSRSGIFSSFILLFGAFFFQKYEFWRQKRSLVIGAASLICLLFLVETIDLDYVLTKLSNPSDPTRSNFIETYFKLMSFENSLYGIDLKDQIFHDPHNSYLNLHSKAGILGLAIIPLLLFALCRMSFKRMALGCLLFGILFRCATDTIYFFGAFDHIPAALVALGLSWHSGTSRSETDCAH